jgi:hypothetical protein
LVKTKDIAIDFCPLPSIESLLKPLRLQHPGKKKARGKRFMTIAAGFLCSDGLLIGADTEHSGSGKFHSSKVRRYTSDAVGDYIVTGAGNVTYMGMAADILEELIYSHRALFRGRDRAKDAHSFRLLLRVTAKAIQDAIKGWPYAADDKPSVELVVAVRFKRTRDAALIHVGVDGGVRTVDGAGVFIGAGAEVAQSFARIVWHQLYPMDTMRWIAVFILYQAKMAAEACSGDTEIFRLPQTRKTSVLDEAGVAEKVEKGMRLALVESRDPDIDDAKFEGRLADYLQSLRDIRKAVKRPEGFDDFVLEELRNLTKREKSNIVR